MWVVLCFPTLAWSADHEISLEAGTTTNRSEGSERIAGSTHQPTYGVRGAIAVHERVAVVLNLAHGQRGAWGGEETLQASAWYLTEWGAGARADINVRRVFFPYAQAQLQGYHSLLRFTDDRSDLENVYTNGRLAAGARAVVGFEIQALPDRQVGPAFHAEIGWAGALPYTHRTEDIDGTTIDIVRMGWSGLTARAGVGARFR
jgi:hypothetical protein